MKISVFMEHIFDAALQERTDIINILKKVKSFSIDGIELDYGRLAADDTLPSVIRSQGLDIACVYAFFDFSHNKDISYPKSVIDNLRKHNIKRLMAIPGFVNDNDDKEKCIADMYECMNALTEMAEKADISLCLEDFDNKTAVFSTIEGLYGFMENVNNLECAFDAGNFIYSGDDALIAFEKLKNKITHVHCKDRSFTPKIGEEPKIALDGRKLYSSPVGYGEIPVEQIVKSLLKTGYDGYFAIEHFGSMNQISDIKKSADKLKEWYNDTCNGME